MGARYFEDFAAGDRFVSPGKTVSEAEMLDFAFRFDPQPIHLDVEAARESPYGGLIASGFHTMVVGFRMLWQTGVFDACSPGACPGIAHGLHRAGKRECQERRRRRCWRIVKPSRRRSRASRLDPKGRVIETLGRRPPPLAMLQHRGAAPSWPRTSMTRCSP